MSETVSEQARTAIVNSREVGDSTHLPALAVDANRIVSCVFPDVSLATWRRWDSSAKIPRGFRLGGRKLWRFDDLKRWAALGFPDRRAFERLRASS